MSSDPEDDALNWAGDESLEANRAATARPDAGERIAPTEPADRSEGGARNSATPATADAPIKTDEPQGAGTVSLLLLGVFGGIYLLYTVGWLVGGLGMQPQAMFLLPAPLYLAGMWAAVLAPALWFAAALALTRHSREWTRVVGLVIGALLLVPWPFVVAGGGGGL